MARARYALIAVLVAGLTVVARPTAAPQAPASSAAPTLDQFLGASSPIEVVAARKVDRIAWIAYERGKRNVYTAAAPDYAPVRLTSFMKDDGVEMTDVTISADGSTVAFVRGSAPNRDGWNANPSGDPNGSEEAIWAASVATPGVSWRVMEGRNPVISPDGRFVLVAKDGQIYRPRLSATATSDVDRGEKPFIREWGTNTAPAWSPDGTKIAFVSNRVDHGFIGVYDMTSHAVKYMAPDVDFDTNPMWSADSKRIVFVRRPGTPFGQQSQPGQGGLGLPAGPAYQPPAGAAGRAGGGGGGGRGGAGRGGGGAQGRGDNPPPAQSAGQAAAPQGQGAQAAGNVPPSAQMVPGLTRATFKGGYTQAIWTADVATAEGHEIWHAQQSDRFTTLPALRFAGDYVVFTGGGGGGGGGRAAFAPGGVTAGQGRGPGGGGAQGAPDEWDRIYSLNYTNPTAKPILLTTTDGLIEDATSSIISPDGKTLFYCTNAKDIERRHIWAVPVAGGEPRQVTTGNGIETRPAPLSSGQSIATLSGTWNMPMSVGLWSIPSNASGQSLLSGSGQPVPGPASMKTGQKIVFPTSRPGFPVDAHVEPQVVITHPEDGAFDIHNQLFLPKDIKPGDKHPAMIFVHGGPVRQMLVGYQYMYVYHQFYATNEWLAAHGYVVLSINYRGGIGYGRSFSGAQGTNLRGNSEYQDVLAGAKYLQSRPDVDTKRIGIYGLSYGGLLTSEALARNSDIFAAGVDYAGVHLYGSSLDPNSVAYQSSAISQIDKWKSPVLLIQGDDDRNVYFAQTVGLVQLLRQRDVYYELVVLPDDVHDSLMYSRWLYLLGRMDRFLQKFLGTEKAAG